MYDTYLYVIANEGVDTQASYPFLGKVRKRCMSYIAGIETLFNEKSCCISVMVDQY